MAWSVDQANIGSSWSEAGGTSASFVTTQNVAAGSWIFVVLAGYQPPGLATFSGGGLTWERISTATSGALRTQIGRAFAHAGLSSGTTLSASFSPGAVNINMGGFSMTGGYANSVVEDTSSSTTVAATWTSGTNTSITADALLVAAGYSFDTISSSTPISPSVENVESNGTASGHEHTLIGQHRILGATGDYDSQGTWGSGSGGTVAACGVVVSLGTRQPVPIGTSYNAASDTFINVTTNAPVPSGAKIFGVWAWDGSFNAQYPSGGGLTWRIDHQGNNYPKRIAITSADAPSGLASATTIGIEFSNACTFRNGTIYYLTGLEAGDVDYGNIGTSHSVVGNGNWFSGNVNTTAGDLLIGGTNSSNDGGSTGSTPTGGNIELYDYEYDADNLFEVVCQIPTSSGNIQAQGTFNSNIIVGRSFAVAYPAAELPSAYAEAVLADSPLYYWQMTEASGALAEEGAGPAINLTGATHGADGPYPAMGTAISFDGTGDYGVSASAIDLSAQNVITVECWFYLDSITSTDTLLDVGGTDSAGDWSVYFLTAAKLSGTMWASAGAWEEQSTPVPPTGEWFHFAMVINRAGAGTGDYITYFNGTAQTQTQESVERTLTGNFSNAVLTIMAYSDFTGQQPGDMCHLAIYAGELTQGQIDTHIAAAQGWVPEQDADELIRLIQPGVRWS